MPRVPRAGRIFLSLWLVFVFFADPMPEISTVRHLYLARAVAERASFTVDAYAHASRGDLAAHGGHLYSGSPPGLGLALTPLARLRATFLDGLPLSPNQVLQVLALIAFQAPLSALTIILLWSLLLDLGFPPARARGTALALGLATPLLFFISKLSDYPLTAFLMVVIARISLAWRRGQHGASTTVLAGLAIGLAWTVNDLAAFLGFVFLAAGAGRASPGRWFTRGLGIALGSLPAVAARGLYAAACFGSPIANPLQFSAAGITVADEYALLGGGAAALAAALLQVPAMVWGLTFGEVGLFLFSPVALLLFGWRRAANAAHTADAAGHETRHAIARAGLIVFLLNAALHAVLLNGLWAGGASWGPRYLLFSAVPIAIAGAWASEGWSARARTRLTAVSAFVTWLGVQYGYSTSVLTSLGHLLLAGPTTPAFRWLWLHWALVPTPERIALVWAETPRLGAYYAFTHPSPFLGYLALLSALAFLWRREIRQQIAHGFAS